MTPEEQRRYWACDECGSTDILFRAWINANTGERLDVVFA